MCSWINGASIAIHRLSKLLTKLLWDATKKRWPSSLSSALSFHDQHALFFFRGSPCFFSLSLTLPSSLVLLSEAASSSFFLSFIVASWVHLETSWARLGPSWIKNKKNPSSLLYDRAERKTALPPPHIHTHLHINIVLLYTVWYIQHYNFSIYLYIFSSLLFFIDAFMMEINKAFICCFTEQEESTLQRLRIVYAYESHILPLQ